jgi:hypothetical protein
MLPSFVTTFIQSLARIAKTMWVNGVRFGFTARATPTDEEAVRPLLSTQEVAPEHDTVMINDVQLPLGYDHKENGAFANADKRLETDDGPIINTFEPAQALHNEHHSSIETTKSFSTDLTLPYETTYSTLLRENAKMQPKPIPVPSQSSHVDRFADLQSLDPSTRETIKQASPAYQPQSDYGEPFLTITYSERISMDVILAPVRGELERLYETTPESLPEYSPRMRANSHAQILKMRLSTIAECIQDFLKDVPEDRRGMMEMKLWYVSSIFLSTHSQNKTNIYNVVVSSRQSTGLST